MVEELLEGSNLQVAHKSKRAIMIVRGEDEERHESHFRKFQSESSFQKRCDTKIPS